MKRKNIIIICALMAVGAPLSSYAQLDSSALNYMLQRPQVAKSYKNKKFMDHMFMEFGFGGNLMGRHNVALVTGYHQNTDCVSTSMGVHTELPTRK